MAKINKHSKTLFTTIITVVFFAYVFAWPDDLWPLINSVSMLKQRSRFFSLDLAFPSLTSDSTAYMYISHLNAQGHPLSDIYFEEANWRRDLRWMRPPDDRS